MALTKLNALSPRDPAIPRAGICHGRENWCPQQNQRTGVCGRFPPHRANAEAPKMLPGGRMTHWCIQTVGCHSARRRVSHRAAKRQGGTPSAERKQPIQKGHTLRGSNCPAPGRSKTIKTVEKSLVVGAGVGQGRVGEHRGRLGQGAYSQRKGPSVRPRALRGATGQAPRPASRAPPHWHLAPCGSGVLPAEGTLPLPTCFQLTSKGQGGLSGREKHRLQTRRH